MANITRYGTSVPTREVFNSLWNGFPWPSSFFGWDEPVAPAATPPANLYETENAYMVVVSVPAVDPNGIDVSIERQTLTISGTRALPMPENSQPLYRGIREGKFTYTFTLPAPVQADRIEAHVEHGVLLLNLPKLEEMRARRIQVKTGAANGNQPESGQPS